MSQSSLLLDRTDPPLIKRARCYERGALEELFNRNIDTVYAFAYALSGEASRAEQVVEEAFSRTLPRLDDFSGDVRGFGALVLRLTGALIKTSGEEEIVVRAEYAKLPEHLKELLAMRIGGELDCERIAYLLHRPAMEVRLQLVEALRSLSGEGGKEGIRPVEEGNLQSFDQLVSQACRGSIPENLQISIPSDGKDLLATVRALNELPREPLGDEARDHLRGSFVAASISHRALWVQRNQRPAMVPGVVISRIRRRLRAASTILILGIAAVTGGAVLSVVSMFSSPDSIFYPIKQLSENVLLLTNWRPVDQAEFEFKLAATRSREAEDMAASGKGDLTVMAMRDHFNALRVAGHDLERDSNRNAKWIDARNRFSSLASQSTAALQGELNSEQQNDAANQIKDLTTQFQSDRQQLDAALGSNEGSSSS